MLMPPSTHRHLRLAVAASVLLAAVLSTVACGSQSGTSLDDAHSQAKDKAGQGAGTAPVDACAQIPAPEVNALLGPDIPGKPTVDGGDASCVWENPDTNYSITLEVGAAGTAPGGRLPDPDPGQSAQPIPDSDGMLLVATDQVEFAAGDRLCFLQVVTDTSQRDKDRATSIRMAGEIRGRL
jgi:hypothetical protein